MRAYVGVTDMDWYRLRTDFGNGQELYAMAGQPILVTPRRRADHPGRDALEWHMDEVYRPA